MAIVYSVDVLALLKNAGYSTYRIRKEKLLAESTLQLIREGKMVSWENLSAICNMIGCQPGDIMEHIPENEGSKA